MENAEVLAKYGEAQATVTKTGEMVVTKDKEMQEILYLVLSELRQIKLILAEGLDVSPENDETIEEGMADS